MAASSFPFISDAQLDQLLANGVASRALADFDPLPVVKLFMPDAGATWLLSEIDPEDHDIAFGLCDLGLGFPELGCVSLSELARLRGMLGLPIEQDPHFSADKRLSTCAKEARSAGRIQACGLFLSLLSCLPACGRASHLRAERESGITSCGPGQGVQGGVATLVW